MTELCRLSTTTYKPQTKSNIQYNIEKSIEGLSDHTVYFCSNEKSACKIQNEVALESSTTWLFSTTNSINFMLEIRLQCGIWLLENGSNLEVIWGHKRSFQLISSDLATKMLTSWLRNDATQVCSKLWMWQMSHYLTRWCQVLTCHVILVTSNIIFLFQEFYSINWL